MRQLARWLPLAAVLLWLLAPLARALAVRTTGAPPPARSSPLLIPATVQKVSDGDTLTVRSSIDHRQLRVRLWGVDAPELGQPGGEEARSAVAQQLQGRSVTLELRDTDRYGRTVAVVRLDTPGGVVDVGEDLVRAGLAWCYRRSSLQYSEEEEAARSARRGLWANADPLPPWAWRTAGSSR